MALVVTHVCDRHKAKGDDKVPAEPEQVGFLGEWRTIDLCPPCKDDVLSAAREAWQDWGVQPTDAVSAPPLPSPAPSRHQRATQKAPQRSVRKPKVAKHFTRETMHGLDALLASNKRRGRPSQHRDFPCLYCPLDFTAMVSLRKHMGQFHPEGLEPDPFTNVICPICGKHTEILGGHTANSHNLTSPQAYRRAAEIGDPQGRVAEVLSRTRVYPGGLALARF